MPAPSSPQEVAAEVARHMVAVPGGFIVLRDEGSGRAWQVRVQPFSLCRTPVTRAQVLALGAALPGPPAGPHAPATDVSFHDAVRLCNALSQAAGLVPAYTVGVSPDADDVRCDFTASGYRLPTEAEWEYACRAGSNEPRYGALADIAWYRENADGVLHDVGMKQPNAWGLHDMLGNAWEWCWDRYDPDVYGPYRVFRGGGFADHERACRASCRRKSHPSLRIDDLGFRVARAADQRPS